MLTFVSAPAMTCMLDVSSHLSRMLLLLQVKAQNQQECEQRIKRKEDAHAAAAKLPDATGPRCLWIRWSPTDSDMMAVGLENGQTLLLSEYDMLSEATGSHKAVCVSIHTL